MKDIAILGGGIVGLATARAILMKSPALKLVVLEKDRFVGQQQSSHSSNVLHSGIYYTPGSERARLCFKGKKMMEEFCDAEDIPYDLCGKLIVATEEEELPRLQALFERGNANGVPNLRLLDREEILQLEPNLTTAIRAIHSPETGIVDYGLVTQHLAADVEKRGGKILTNFECKDFRKLENGEGIRISDQVDARNVLNCTGLHADRVSVALGGKPQPYLVPVRGDYMKVNDSSLVSGLVYPVPNPALPFLGIHLTKTMDGNVTCGPNAMLAFAREGYSLSNINIKDLADMLSKKGLWSLAFQNKWWAMQQLFSATSASYFAGSARKFVPALKGSDLSKGGAGVRALAISDEGKVIDDFVYETTLFGGANVINIRNAPSPAATSSLAIAEVVSDLCITQFKL